jgi:perosamine synthetase
VSDFIPVNVPLLNGNERKYLNECIDTGWISSEGPFVKKFEDEFAKLVNKKYAISVTSGSSALEAAISAFDLKEGDEVILPTFTIISCVNPLIRLGVVPVFIDSNVDTWNMDVSQIEDKITSKTKAIMAVHIFGLPVNMDPLIKLAEEYGLLIIEDAAQAIGLEYKGRPCGSFGDISTFSFYSNKLITSGEGGMIVTDNEELAERCRSLRNLCFQPAKRFVHDEMGWNFRMTNLQAAVGLAQLEQLSESVIKKRWIGKKYQENLKEVEDLIQLPLQRTEYSENIYWVFALVLNDKTSFSGAIELMNELKTCGVGSRPFFWSLNEQPVLKDLKGIDRIRCPVSENISRNGFYIPSGLALTADGIDKVSDSLIAILHKNTL